MKPHPFPFENLEDALMKLHDALKIAPMKEPRRVPREKVSDCMVAIYDAYSIARVVSGEEIQALIDMGAPISQSIFYCFPDANNALRSYLAGEDPQHKHLCNAAKVVAFARIMKQYAPKEYFLQLKERAFPLNSFDIPPNQI